jgi:hypothetical protein
MGSSGGLVGVAALEAGRAFCMATRYASAFPGIKSNAREAELIPFGIRIQYANEPTPGTATRAFMPITELQLQPA